MARSLAGSLRRGHRGAAASRVRAGARALALVMVAGALGACVSVDGGAFEAVWVLFDDQGRAINDCNCSDPPIASVAFQIVGTGRNGSTAGATPCAGRSACVFGCQRQTGATPFDIPPGEYAFTLVALDRSGTPLGGQGCGTDGGAFSPDLVSGGDAGTEARCVDSPAQILRQVVRGQATDVNALPLMTHCSGACSGVSGSGMCAHP